MFGVMRLLTHDTLFLEDYVRFGSLSHLSAALAIRRGIRDANEVATDQIMLTELPAPTERITREEGKRRATERDADGSVAHILFAKLFAEYIAAIEDFGAFLHAVAHRDDGGVFFQFSNARDEVGKVFDALGDDTNLLPQLLNLPELSALSDHLAPDELTDLTDDYQRLSDHAPMIGQMYRTIVPYAQFPSSHQASLPADVDGRFCVIIEYRPRRKKGKTQRKTVRPVIETLNKLKHRFLVIEDFAKFYESIDSEDELLFVHHPIVPELPDQLVDSIAGIAGLSGELASVLLLLDARGLLP